MVKRLHRAMLLPLCLSMLLSAVPVHASEAGRGNSAVEAAVTEGETVAEEGGEAAAIEETAEVTELSAAGEAEEAAGAAEEEAATGETAEAATEVAAEVEPDSAGEAAEEAATGETVEVAAAGETTEVAASAEAADTAVAVPEVTTVAEPALKSTAGTVEKIAQMKLEVIDYLDEGFGDSQMLSSGGSRLLIDTYSQGAWDVLNSWLNDKKYMDFDIYISHYHNDHMGNVVNILNDGKYKVNKLYLPDYSYMTGSNSYMQDYRSDCADLMNTAKNKGVQIVTLVKDSVFKIGDVVAEVLWGANYKDSNHNTDYINNNSLVTRFTCGNTRYLNAGDIEVETEFDMLDAGVDLSADICKLSHHGGDTSNTYDFLEAVGAEFYYYNYCGDTPSRFSPSDSWTYWSVHDAQELGNVASVRYNGNITYGVYDDVITQELERNYVTRTVYLYDPADPKKLRGIVTEDYNKASTLHFDDRAFGGYDYSTAKRSGTYADDGWIIGNGDTQYYYKNNQPVKGWLTDGGAKYYMDPVTGKKETGWLTVGSDTYFFDEFGKMKTGFVKIGTAFHHFDAQGRQTKTGWATIDGKRYYFGAYNKLVFGVQTIGGKKYYFDTSTGVLRTGKIVQGGRTYFANASGVLYPAGWLYSNGWYYLDGNGRAVTGWKLDAGKWYYMGSNGVMKTGWQRVGGVWYYMDSNGIMRTGWQYVGGKWYYMNGSGVMQTGWKYLGGAWYYMDSSGAMKTGWQYIGGKWYYMNSSGVMKTGWQYIGGKWYYMNSSGVMKTGWQYIGGKWYYMNGSGAMQTGWRWLGGNWYYMDRSGAMTTGWQYLGGKWYFMDSSGAMRTDWQRIKGVWYYLGSDGAMRTGWQYIRGEWYYMDGSGAMVTGWRSIGGKWYHFSSSGAWTG